MLCYLFAPLFALGGAVSLRGYAFSGEDVLRGNSWYHQLLTEQAALVWFLASGDGLVQVARRLHRLVRPQLVMVRSERFEPLKVSLAIYDELLKLHFDDLFSTQQVEVFWRPSAEPSQRTGIWHTSSPPCAEVTIPLIAPALKPTVGGAEKVGGGSQNMLHQLFFLTDPSLRIQNGLVGGKHPSSKQLLICGGRSRKMPTHRGRVD